MAVNNAWVLHRPNFWVSVDRPGSFLHAGWMDGGTLKFTPGSNRLRPLRERDEEGKFHETKTLAKDAPSSFFFVREDTFDHRTFFTSPFVSWGTLARERDSLGLEGARSVMLCAIRLAHWMGFSHLYLLGCDLFMPPRGEKMDGGPYSFAQDKHQKGRDSNNKMYVALAKRLAALPLPSGFEIFNCNPASRLGCFPHVPFEEAVERHRRDKPHMLRTDGWYT